MGQETCRLATGVQSQKTVSCERHALHVRYLQQCMYACMNCCLMCRHEPLWVQFVHGGTPSLRKIHHERVKIGMAHESDAHAVTPSHPTLCKVGALQTLLAFQGKPRSVLPAVSYVLSSLSGTGAGVTPVTAGTGEDEASVLLTAASATGLVLPGHSWGNVRQARFAFPGIHGTTRLQSPATSIWAAACTSAARASSSRWVIARGAWLQPGDTWCKRRASAVAAPRAATRVKDVAWPCGLHVLLG